MSAVHGTHLSGGAEGGEVSPDLCGGPDGAGGAVGPSLLPQPHQETTEQQAHDPHGGRQGAGRVSLATAVDAVLLILWSFRGGVCVVDV